MAWVCGDDVRSRGDTPWQAGDTPWGWTDAAVEGGDAPCVAGDMAGRGADMAWWRGDTVWDGGDTACNGTDMVLDGTDMGSKCLGRRFLRGFRRYGSKRRLSVVKNRQFGASPPEISASGHEKAGLGGTRMPHPNRLPAHTGGKVNGPRSTARVPSRGTMHGVHRMAKSTGNERGRWELHGRTPCNGCLPCPFDHSALLVKLHS